MASSPTTDPPPEALSPPAPPTTPSPPEPSLSPPPSSPLPEPPTPSLSPPPLSPPPAPSLSPPPLSPPPAPSLSPPPLSPPPAPAEPSTPTITPPTTPNPSNPPPATTLSPPDSSSSRSPLPPPSPSNASPTHPSPSTIQPTPSTGRSPPPSPSRSAKQHSRDKDEPSKSPRPDKQPSDNLQQLPMIIGVVVGVGLFVIILGSVFLCCYMKKKKKRSAHDHMQYYADPKGPQGGRYCKNNSNWQYAAQQEEHIIKIPPPPGVVVPTGTAWPSPTPPPGRGWASPPPPPLPMMSSSDMSSNFSGSNQPALPPPSSGLGLGFNKSSFSYDELAAATSGFSNANILGQGGFGYVYKGVFPTGKEVAVKQLKSGSNQGEREFQAEVEIISRVHHRYLVSLTGYCIADGQRMLVYEFVPNNTLEYHLHGKGLPTMDWPTRLKIALESAKGLAYLHEDCHPRIIHRDIKASNILLDFNFDAKVADFGLAKLSEDKNTHISTRVMGTFGYLAPEYASSGKLTEKSDVFSFGVMLLELITGRRPVDPKLMDDCLVDWARPILKKALEDGDYTMLVDQHLNEKYNPNEMGRMVACAAASIRHSSRKRPKMSKIVRALEGDVSLDDLNEGVKPGSSSVFSSSDSSEYDAGSYNADMKKFRKMALDTSTQGSVYSAATSEYGLHPSSLSSSDDGHSQETESTEEQKHH